MPALNFTKELAPLVESGEKRQTIRPLRKDKRDPHAGQRLVFFTAQRTRKCRKLGEAVCTGSDFITIESDARIRIGNKPLAAHEYDELAKADGFSDFEAFVDFFRRYRGLPFEGVLIRW